MPALIYPATEKLQQRNKNFSLCHSIQSGSGAHSTSYPVGMGRVFPLGLKQLGHEVDHSPPSSAKVKTV